jgi:hypothetical protein
MRLVALATFGLVLLGSPFAARAACDPGLSTCIDADTFWPHAGPAYFTGVGSTAVTPRGSFGFGWVTTYLTRPVVLLVPSSQTSGTEVAGVNHLLDATFLFSYGLAERIDVNVAIPVALYQTGTGISAMTSQASRPIDRTALRDIRAGATFALLTPPANGGFSLASRLELSLPTGAEGSFNGDRTAVMIPGFAAEFRRAGLVMGSEVGARLRGTSDLAGTRVGSQLAFSLGIGGELLTENRLSVLLEAVILPTLVTQHELSPVANNGDRVVTGDRRPLMPTEWMASLRTASLMSGDMAVNLGVGGSLGLAGESGVTSPSFRATLSVRYTPREKTAK